MRNLPSLMILAPLLLACGNDEHVPAPQQEVPGEQTAANDALLPYRQLIGAWMDSTTSARFSCFEEWRALGDTALEGFGYGLAQGDTIYFEDLRLAQVDGEVVYFARISSQNDGQWVPFTAQPNGTDSLVFENPGHDFPQCITYVRNNAGGWDVLASGNEGGAERIEEFHFASRTAPM